VFIDLGINDEVGVEMSSILRPDAGAETVAGKLVTY
jgi:hypothetical protein